MTIVDLPTPCLLLDRRVMRSNIRRMQQHITAGGTSLRPHLKTSKSIEIAEEIARGHGRSITVSTLREADYFGSRGFRDILYAVAPPPGKLAQVVQLIKRGIDLTIVADNEASVRAIADYGRQSGTRIPVLLEIDCDRHRSGLSPDPCEVAPLARDLVESKGALFRGIMTHAGGAYDAKDVASVRSAAGHERDVMVGLGIALAEAQLPCGIVSIGSTPTALLGQNFQGVSEVRAGVFVFNDLTMVNLGVCGLRDLALSVLTTVIGHRAAAGELVTDGGWMALSADLSTQGRATDYRYGLVCDGSTGESLEDLVVVAANQEHGVIGRRNGGSVDLAQYPIGRLLRILPVHACATAAAHESYHVTDGPVDVVAEWQRCRGWSVASVA
jgi:D-serine deaminase-like pyridoxal phosphate-dependent protein